MTVPDYIEVVLITVLISITAAVFGWELDRLAAISVALLFFIAHCVAKQRDVA